MLTQCPECSKQISDKALFCPFCGYPFDAAKLRKTRQRSAKRKRLPNGFGQISKLSNPRLRKPYRAMITIGKTDTGRPICKSLKPVAYFATYNEAYAALLQHSKDPLQISDKTFEAVFEEWKRSEKRSESVTSVIGSVFMRCEPLYAMPFTSVRAINIKNCILNAPNTTATMKTIMKTYLGMLYNYAVECGYVDRNYAKEIKLPKELRAESAESTQHHVSFTDEEMAKLWSNPTDNRMMLVQCYSGWRPIELITLKLKDVNIKEWTFTGGVKTAAGINRTVPIHSAIQQLVLDAYNEATDACRATLFSYESYPGYRKHFQQHMKKYQLNTGHRPHDCRKQFVTMAKKANVDEYAIKRIVGHSIPDITEAIYTDRSIEWLRSEMEKIKGPVGIV